MQAARGTKMHWQDPTGITSGPACGSRSDRVTKRPSDVTCRTCAGWLLDMGQHLDVGASRKVAR